MSPRSRVLVVCTAALLGFWPHSLRAQPVTASATSFTLPEAVGRGVTQNLPLLGERLERAQRAQLTRAAWRPYSPSIVLNAGVSRPGTLPSQLSYAAGAYWQSPWGTRLSAEALMTRGLETSGRDQGALVLGVAQPLLKDAWLTGAALPLKEAELLQAMQEELFRDALNTLVAEVETAYWDLALADADVEIKTRSRDRAQQQFEDTRENIRRGILAEAEIYVVEENVVFFQQELVQAEENLRRARTRLGELLSLSPGAQLQATQSLEAPDFPLPDREALIASGRAQSPRIAAQRLRQTLAQERERYAWNQALPQVDLTAQVSILGTEQGYPAPGDPTLTGAVPDTRMGLLFALPLDLGAVGAQVEAATLQSKQATVELQAAEQAVEFELNNGLNELETNLRLLTMTTKQVELAELKLAAETEKYKNGLSTLNDVVRFQRDLDNVLIRLQRVRRSVFVGRARLLASVGTLHQAMGVELR